MRLIDADEILKTSRIGKVLYFDDTTTDGYTDVLLAVEVERAPTIEAGPVRHGKWERLTKSKIARYCSLCGTRHVSGSANNFCPKCGAKMVGGEDG